jgi:predicted phosphodiesterase
MTEKLYIRPISDLHLECDGGKYSLTPLEHDEDTVLIIAGDGHIEDRLVEWIAKNCNDFLAIVYVLGNHEHYNYSVDQTAKRIEKTMLEYSQLIDRLFILDRAKIVIRGVEFIGTTLWTDLNCGDPLTQFTVQRKINDFSYIRVQNFQRRFHPADWRGINYADTTWMSRVFNNSPEVARVVVTHHLPSFKSVNPRYQIPQEYHANGGFASNFDELISKSKAKFWIHGHTHDSCNYMVGDTNVICNPRGYYPDQLNAKYNDTLIYEVL